MRADVPLWEPPITSADGLEVEYSTSADSWAAASLRDFEVGTWPSHPLVASVEVAASAAPSVRYRWTSGADYHSEWSEGWLLGSLAPEWLWPHEAARLSLSRHVAQENLVSLSRMIRQARLSIIEDVGEVDMSIEGAIEACRQASLRMVEWIAEGEAASTISTASGLQQEKIGSYSFYRNETAADAWTRVAGSVPPHVTKIMLPFTSPLAPVSLCTTDVFAPDFDPYDPDPGGRYAWDR